MVIELVPQPGRALGDVAQVFGSMREECNTASSNVFSDPAVAFIRYVLWAASAVQRLTNVLRGSEVSDLIYTKHYFAISQTDHFSPAGAAQLTSELRTLGEVMAGLATEAENLQRQWATDGTYVVLDTTHLVQTTELFDAIDWPTALEIAYTVHLVVPMAVVDELDGLKRVPKVRSYARQTVKKLTGSLEAGTSQAVISTSGANHQFATTIQVLRDRLDHTRFADNDSEIMSRAVWRRDINCGDVRFATWDGGPALRASGEGLRQFACPKNSKETTSGHVNHVTTKATMARWDANISSTQMKRWRTATRPAPR